MKHVIIGNGIAGVCAAEAIRILDATADITMIGDETFPPYSRPMISHVLDGSQPHSKLPIRSDHFYDELKITPLLGQRASAIDVDNKQVHLADGTRVNFERLLIATGADPRPLKAEGLDLKNIFYMRTQDHVKQQVAALDGARRAVVLGGGLVGFKAAYGLLKRGLEVTMLITSGYPLSMQVDQTAGHMILDELVHHGLKVEVGVSACAFEGNGSVQVAVTDAGTRLPCDMVIVGKGVLPARTFIPKDRIDLDLGVVVDDHLQTSAPDIYAAGDVAESVDIARACRWVNALWPEAASQGRVAGLNMAGRPVAYPGSLSRNVMRVFGLDVLTVGNANPQEDAGCRVVETGGADKKYYRHLVLKDDILVGVVMINRIEQGGVLRSLIENRIPIRLPPEILITPGFNFGRLLS
ncbi:MAG: NAD(P)/FAD-dependent oxidoreductase [Desulfosarcina sp.]|nr:NAD(P)/FAD-dependent oxidoreductase [Desulfosarcina sp.]MBC2743562.1 NAD(P)/FAD-dependent oxidoreductase [Desulfosarcina sp.]MBC2766471.1 NAD(P)/FAD-dependent oxidoreductase [Desulfosarcina sp.]